MPMPLQRQCFIRMKLGNDLEYDRVVMEGTGFFFGYASTQFQPDEVIKNDDGSTTIKF